MFLRKWNSKYDFNTLVKNKRKQTNKTARGKNPHPTCTPYILLTGMTLVCLLVLASFFTNVLRL